MQAFGVDIISNDGADTELDHRLLADPLLAAAGMVEAGSGCRGAIGAVVGVAVVLELPVEGGGLLPYGEPGLELEEAGGDLLPDLVDCAFDLGLAVSLPFCCCLVFALLFLNQT